MTPIAPKAQNALRSVRHRAGLTQRELSQRTGLPASTVARLDNPTAKINLEQAAKLAVVLQVNVLDLLPR